MSGPIDIRPADLAIVQNILREALPAGAKVFVFGSRALWTTHDGSDLDLAIDAGRKLTRDESLDLAEAFEESDLPYTVDVVDLHDVSASFKAIVERDMVRLPGGAGAVLTMRMVKTMRLGDNCDKIGSGATPRGGKETYLNNGPVALIRSQNVYNDRFVHAGLAYISDQQSRQLQNVEVKKGDVLLNITGDSVARVCQVDPSILPARVNQHVAIIRPRANRINSHFLRYYLVTPSAQAHLLGLAAAGATRNALTKAMIERLCVPAWPVDEQRAIASVLGALDDKIELNRRMNETLEAMARAIFKDWFVDFGPTRARIEGRANSTLGANGASPTRAYLAPDIWPLFPDRLDDEGKPEGWVFGTLGDVAHQVGESVQPEALDPGTPYIGLEHMPRKSIALSEWEGAGKVTSGKLSFRKGDFLFGKLRPYFHKVGIAPIDGICSTDIVVLNALEPKATAFVLACISQDEFVAFTDRTSDGTKMPRTSWGRMERYGLCLPGRSVLEAFNSCVGPLLDRIVSNIHESRALAATRDFLLPKLMSGEVRVKDAEKLVGEAI